MAEKDKPSPSPSLEELRQAFRECDQRCERAERAKAKAAEDYLAAEREYGEALKAKQDAMEALAKAIT